MPRQTIPLDSLKDEIRRWYLEDFESINTIRNRVNAILYLPKGVSH